MGKYGCVGSYGEKACVQASSFKTESAESRQQQVTDGMAYGPQGVMW